MRVGQRESHRRMVEGRRLPSNRGMAGLASLREPSGDVVRAGGSLKVLKVAGDAGRARQIVVVVDVAIEADARRVSVRIGQRESDGRVIKFGIQPSVRAVTLFAGCRKTCRCVIRVSRVFEVLRVAGIALCRESLELPCGRPFMARLTVDSRVCPDQREAVLVIANRCNGNIPALDGMARLTICSELSPVNIRVAVRALLSHICKNEFHMALRALHFFVHSAQRIARLVVVKFRNTADGLPTEGSVAVFTGDVDRAVRIVCNWFLHSAMLRLGVGLKREQANSDLEQSSTEHDATSFDDPLPSFGVWAGIREE